MTIFTLISLLNALILISLANFVFYLDRKNTANKAFAALCLLLGWWAFAEFMYRQANSIEVAVVWVKTLSATWPFVPATVLHFALAFVGRRASGCSKPELAIIYAPALVVSLIEIFTNLIELPPVRESWGYSMQLNLTSWVGWCAYLWGISIGATAFSLCLRNAFVAVDKADRSKSLLVSAALCVPIAVIVVFELILPAAGMNLPEFSTVSFVWLSAMCAYAMWRYELFTLDPKRAADKIIDIMSDALFLLDGQGRIIQANRAAMRLTGYEIAQLNGRHFDELLDGREAWGAGRVMVEDRATAGTDVVIRCMSGATVPVSIACSTVLDRNQNPYGSVCIARDVTERRNHDNAMKALTQELARSNRELTDFAHVASHDLQEPLRKVTSFADRLRLKYAPVLDEQGLDYIKRMCGAVQRMSGLIDGLLDYARVSTKAQPFATVDLNVVAAEVIDDLELRIQENGGRVEVASLPVLDADPLQMRQLLQNLIGNGLKYRREGVAPVVKVLPVATEDESCGFEVIDNGIGIAQEHFGKLFVVFQRLHAKGTYEGTGVGLAICRKIIERHHGTITISSVEGESTTFTVNLPLKQVGS